MVDIYLLFCLLFLLIPYLTIFLLVMYCRLLTMQNFLCLCLLLKWPATTPQITLKNFITRCNIVGLTLNNDKCKVMTFNRARDSVLFDYQNDGSLLTRVFRVVYLVFVFSSTSSFGLHIDVTVCKTLQMFDFFRITVSNFDSASRLVANNIINWCGLSLHAIQLSGHLGHSKIKKKMDQSSSKPFFGICWTLIINTSSSFQFWSSCLFTWYLFFRD